MPYPTTFLRDVPGALTALSAMVTPAILVSACGALVLTTSQRLSRSLERVRAVAGALKALREATAGARPTPTSTATSPSNWCFRPAAPGSCKRP